MITREKLLRNKSASWNVAILALLVILFLAGTAMVFYWYAFGGRNSLIAPKAQPSPGAYVYPRYKLENVIKQKIFGTSVDVSR